MASDTDAIVNHGEEEKRIDDTEEEELVFADAGTFHPSRLPYKFIVLFFICFLSFGSYFCYDNPTALQKQILRDMDVTLSDYTILYSVYSWPNVILSVVGGFLVDAVFGIRLGAIIFSLFVAAGQIVFALGGFTGNFWLMILGRFIFGLGGENLAVCQNLYSALWFKGSMLNMVFGVQLSISRLGSSANLWTMVPIYNSVASPDSSTPGYVALGLALFIGGIFCLFSLVCAVSLLFLDSRGSKILRRKERTDKVTWADLKQITEVRHFPLQMWLICGICVFYYIAVFPFVGIAQTFFIMKYGLDTGSANTVNSLIYFTPLFTSPILGFVIDRTGKNIYWIMVGCVLTTIAHGMFGLISVSPYFCAVLLGFSYSILASSLWPLVAYVLPESQLGTGYGVMQAVQNLGLAVMPLVAGVIVDAKGYLILEILFLLCLFAAISCTLLLWIVDDGRTKELNMSTSDRKALAESRKAKKA